MLEGDDVCPEVMINLKKARNICMQMTRILGWEGSNLRVSGMFFKEVVQAVFIFGSDTLVTTPFMERDLGSF